MKPTPLMVALLLPAAAIASQEAGQLDMDPQQLGNHLPASRILGAEVQSDNGRNLAIVEDIMFDQQGNITSVVVQREGRSMTAEQGGQPRDSGQDAAVGDDREPAQDAAGEDASESGAGMADVRAERRQRTDREGNGMDIVADLDRADTIAGGNEFVELQWSDVSYNVAEQVLRVSRDAFSEMQTVQYNQSGGEARQGGVRASTLIGLEISLSDEESFGEVEDVMIDSSNGKASALVVDTMEFFNKERYALPIQLEGLNRENESLTLQLTQQQVKAMGEFEMDD